MKNDLIALATAYSIVFASIAAYFVFMALRGRQLRIKRAELARRAAAEAPPAPPAVKAAAPMMVADPLPAGVRS